MNSCNFVGRLTANPELKTTQSGISVCRFTLAVNRPKVKDTTDFINCTAWRQSAEYLSSYGRKGAQVAVSGVLTQHNYTDKDGNKRVSYEIVADSLSLCESKTKAETGAAQAAQSDFSLDLSNDDDLPF